MKTRTGFVSNSSSSSFVIAVPTKTKTCKCCNRSDDWMLEAVCKYLSTLTETGNQMWTMTSQESVLDYFKKELDELLGSKKYSEEQLASIVELEKDPLVFENYEKLKRHLDRSRWKITLAQEARSGENLLTPKKELTQRKEAIKKHLDEYDAKVKELESLIAKMQKYHAKDYRVYAFTIDNWATKAETALKAMMRDGVVEVIHSAHS